MTFFPLPPPLFESHTRPFPYFLLCRRGFQFSFPLTVPSLVSLLLCFSRPRPWRSPFSPSHYVSRISKHRGKPQRWAQRWAQQNKRPIPTQACLLTDRKKIVRAPRAQLATGGGGLWIRNEKQEKRMYNHNWNVNTQLELEGPCEISVETGQDKAKTERVCVWEGESHVPRYGYGKPSSGHFDIRK